MQTRGFSLMEFLIVFGIILIISAMIFGSLNDFRRNQTLTGATELVLSRLALARSQAISSKDASTYGLHFDSDQVVLFKGVSYSAGNVTNEVTALPAGAEITTALAGGGSNIIFARLTGTTQQTGSVTVGVSGATTTRTITIKASGVAGAN